MLSFLSYELQSKILKIKYRYRLLFNYVVIGFVSILLELVLLNALSPAVNKIAANLIAVLSGVLFAFYLNVRFNFKVPKPKRNKAFLFFLLISFLSYALNNLLRLYMVSSAISYGESRLTSSGVLFLIGYVLHRKFSFRSYKQVGIAVYAHGNENIKVIWEKIKFVGDFIHIDIVDRTFNENAPDPTTYRLETVRAYWPGKEIHCHIMSKTPSMWIEKIIEYVDVIVVHYEIQENLADIIASIKTAKKKAGICLLLQTPVDVVIDFLPLIDEIMLLAIAKPGISGQKFDVETLDKIAQIDNFQGRSKVSICVDGGINGSVIDLISVEKVVSGSYVLDARNPLKRIVRLQTSGEFNRT